MKKSLLVLLAIGFIFTSCGEKSKEAQLKSKKEEFEKLRKEITELETEIAKGKGDSTNIGKAVKVISVATSNFTHYIDIQGHVDADESVTVSPTMPGLVKRVNVQAGDKVVAGQVLAEIDADAMVQQLNALKLQRDMAKEVYNRQKNLWDQKIGSELQFLQTQTQYESLNKQVAAVTEQIDMAYLRAPMAGVVDHVTLKVGEIAAAGLSSIVIVNTTKLRVKGEVAEGYISRIHIGNPVSIEIPDAGKTLEARITYSGQIVNKMNRTFNVEVIIPSNEKDVLPNMIAVLKINDFSSDSSLVIPMSAIQQSSDGKKYVFVAKTDGGKTIADKREITYTNNYNGYAMIDSGLAVGDQLITEGCADLNVGDAVMVK